MVDKHKLMEISIFKNAYKIHHGGLIRLDSVSISTVYYDCEDPSSGEIHQVSVGFDKKKKVVGANCDCTISSIKSKYYPLCSHKIAALTRAMFDFGRPKKARLVKSV